MIGDPPREVLEAARLVRSWMLRGFELYGLTLDNGGEKLPSNAELRQRALVQARASLENELRRLLFGSLMELGDCAVAIERFIDLKIAGALHSAQELHQADNAQKYGMGSRLGLDLTGKSV